MDNKTQISLKSIIWISDIRALKSCQSMDVMGILPLQSAIILAVKFKTNLLVQS